MPRKGWEKQEKDTAKRHGGTRNAGSGNHWTRKGDVRTPKKLIEAKWTGNRQITLKADDLEKIYVEALSEGREPVMIITVGGRNWVLQSEDDYLAT